VKRHIIYGITYEGRAAVEAAVRALAAKASLTQDERETWNSLNEVLDEYVAEAERGIRSRRVQEIARSGDWSHTGEQGDGSGYAPQPQRNQALISVWDRRTNEARDAGLRAVERMGNDLSAKAGDRLVDVVQRDSSGLDARYLDAVSKPEFRRAFMRRITNPEGAVYEMDAAEVGSMRDAIRVESERALSVGSAVLPIPASMDPTIILTSDGALSPLRDLASHATIANSTWQGVTSAGITASFDAEMAEVSDDTPTLAAPTITPQKAQAWVEYSIEAGQDWTSLASEMTSLLQDARDVLEADVFINGPTGTNQPVGMMVGVSGTVGVVTSAGTAAFAVADLYTLQNALPARYSPRARWLSSLTIANVAWQFVKPGDVTNAEVWNDDRTLLLGKPWSEVSVMSKVQTTTTRNLYYGDVAATYKIVDRIGMAIETVPVLLGSNRRPTGKRGIYVYWRVGGAVINSNACRILAMK
jgi:HK97 family phage major capsid protein